MLSKGETMPGTGNLDSYSMPVNSQLLEENLLSVFLSHRLIHLGAQQSL